MEKLALIISRFLSNKKNNETNKIIARYLIFVVFAAIFWFLNALSKDYTITVSYPVIYSDFPKDKAIIKELPDELTMEVKGYGFALLRYQISTAFLPISFNINSYTDNKLVDNNILNYTIVTNNLKSRIAKKISKDIQIISISPDTINLHFSKIVEKKVAIRAVIKADYANQYALNGKIDISPDSVIIYAPKVIADTIHYIKTNELVFKNLNKSIKRNVTLKEIEGIKYSFKRTIVNIPVDQFIESSKEINIETKNVPDDVRLRLFPSKIKLSYRVGLSNYKNIKEKDFKLSVDYNELTSLSNVLKVNLEKYPDFLTHIEISPSKVESIIEKK